MSETATRADRRQINSIVLGAAENKARSMGIEVEPGAFDALLRKAQKYLDTAWEKNELEERRAQITDNTEILIEHIINENKERQSGKSTLTFDNMAFSLKDICKYFEDLSPLCP